MKASGKKREKEIPSSEMGIVLQDVTVLLSLLLTRI
jgi:hypothetical protein